MTAVAPPPSFQPVPRSAWHTGSGAQGSLNSMSTEDVSRIFMPRKNLQRTNSSSSAASSSSSSSTLAGTTPQSHQNGAPLSSAGDLSGWGVRKKPVRNLWPSSKAEPASAISTARPQLGQAQGPLPVSAMPNLYQPPSILPSQHVTQVQQPNGVRGNPVHGHGEGNAVLCLLPMNGTFERKTINVPFFPEVLRIGRQTNAKTLPTPLNGYFDSKVLSRQHAEIWADKLGKIWIRDVKSSNGTFVNGQRLSRENHDSDPHELREQDILELGIDIVSEDQKSVVHHKVAARVEHAGFYASDARLLDLSFGDIDPTSGSGLMSSPQAMRGRAGSHGSLAGNGRFGSTSAGYAGNNVGGMAQQRHLNFWLTPITMEQIIKRLTNELRAARQQSFDLQRTGEFFNALLTHGVVKEDIKPVANEKAHLGQATGIPVKAEAHSPFSEPPAPPPQQPLPEKPDIIREESSEGPMQPSIKRSETERPRLLGDSSPTKSHTSHQIVFLVEALASAKQEIDAQGARVKHLEEVLQEERVARESAEHRAQQLEKQSRGGLQIDPAVKEEGLGLEEAPRPSEESIGGQHKEFLDYYTERENGGPDRETPTEIPDSENQQDSSARLQQRLELMVAEMKQMKHMMEGYKARVEVAEKESASSRKSLVEMIEKIRLDEAKREAKQPELDVAEESISRTDDGTLKGAGPTSVNPSGYTNGRNGGVLGSVDNVSRISDLARMRSPHDHFVHSAPYASILGVVALGVGLMAYLNGWQKVER